MTGIPDKKKLVLFISILLVVSFTATSLLNYLNTTRSFSRDMKEDVLPLTSDNIYSEIQKDLIRLIFISSMMATDTFLRDWVIDGENGPELITKYLSEIKEEYSTITSFFVSEKTHKYYYPEGILKTVDSKKERDQWYFRVRDMVTPYEINVDPDLANKDELTIFINFKVFDYQNNYLGATGCGLTVTSVKKLLDSYAERYQRTIYFINRDGEVTLTSKNSLLSFSNLNEIDAFKTLELQREATASQTLDYTRNNIHYILNTRFIPELDWYLFVEQSTQNNDSQIRGTLLQNLLINLFISILIVWIIFSTISFYQKELENMATTDELTGLLNRHALDLLFTQAIQETERDDSQPLTCIMFDIDRFKKINDELGHQTGDAVLISVAETTKQVIRKSDIICRWGGEEFLIILKSCTIDQGKELGEKLRQSISDTLIYYDNDTVRVQISLGITQWKKGEQRKDLFKRVDQALYTAKRKGRNRLETAV